MVVAIDNGQGHRDGATRFGIGDHSARQSLPDTASSPGWSHPHGIELAFVIPGSCGNARHEADGFITVARHEPAAECRRARQNDSGWRHLFS